MATIMGMTAMEQCIYAYVAQGIDCHLKRNLRTRLAEEKRDFASILQKKTKEIAEQDRYRTHPIIQYQKLK